MRAVRVRVGLRRLNPRGGKRRVTSAYGLFPRLIMIPRVERRAAERSGAEQSAAECSAAERSGMQRSAAERTAAERGGE